MKKIKSLVLLAFLLFTSSGCGDDYIDSVKEGIFPRYSNSVTVGNALEYWAKQQNCDSTKWEKIITERKEIVVSFSCVIEKDSNLIKEYTDSFNKDYESSMARFKRDLDFYKNNRNEQLRIEEEIKSLKADKEIFSEALQQFDKIETLFQFALTADNESFDIRFLGFVYYFLDGTGFITGTEGTDILRFAYKGYTDFIPRLGPYHYKNRG